MEDQQLARANELKAAINNANEVINYWKQATGFPYGNVKVICECEAYKKENVMRVAQSDFEVIKAINLVRWQSDLDALKKEFAEL